MAYNAETKMYEGCIYKITNKINNKSYIGQTRKPKPIYRFNEHASLYNKSNCYIDNAMRYYGKENFSFDVIKTIQTQTLEELKTKLNELEIYYISKYNTYYGYGYNNTIGGETGNTKGVFVDQYTIYGEFCKTYQSISEACMHVGLSGGNSIHQVCDGRRRTAGGFVWRFNGEPFDKYNINDKKYTSVKLYNLNGKLLGIYSSLSELSKYLNISASTISANCKGRIHIIKNKYVCRYFDDEFNDYLIFTTDKKEVDVYDYTQTIVEHYESLSAAAKEYNTTTITISEACKGKTMTIKGKVFRFCGEPFNKYKVKFRACWQFDLDKNFIKEYKNQSIASNETGISLSGIQKCVAGKIKTFSGYYFLPIGMYP